MRAESVRRALAAGGPLMRDDLCRATGLSRERVMVEVWKLRQLGCVIEQDTAYTLVYDPELELRGRICRWPECTTPLRASNATGFCAVHVRDEVRRRCREMPAEERDRLLDELTGRDPAEHQLELEEVMTS